LINHDDLPVEATVSAAFDNRLQLYHRQLHNCNEQPVVAGFGSLTRTINAVDKGPGFTDGYRSFAIILPVG